MIEQMFDPSEQVFWRGKPNKFVYVVGHPSLYVFAFFWLVFDLFMIFMLTRADLTQINFFLLPFFLLHLAPVWVAIISPIYRFFAWSKIDYAITNRRVYIGSGIIGRDFQSIELYAINQAMVNVGVIERMKNCGTVTLNSNAASTAKNTYKLKHIYKPYEVYNLLKRISLDVATDVQYPNAFRPQENPGYRTNYHDPNDRFGQSPRQQ